MEPDLQCTSYYEVPYPSHSYPNVVNIKCVTKRVGDIGRGARQSVHRQHRPSGPGAGRWHRLPPTPEPSPGGANFHHDAARAAADTRAAAGKGVNRARTFGNTLSSQALCFNLMGPLAASPEDLWLSAELLQAFVPGLVRVRKVEIEFTPPGDVFSGQFDRADFRSKT